MRFVFECVDDGALFGKINGVKHKYCFRGTVPSECSRSESSHRELIASESFVCLLLLISKGKGVSVIV